MIRLLIILFILLLIDLYVFQAIKTAVHNFSGSTRSFFYWLYWSFTVITILGIFCFRITSPMQGARIIRLFILGFLFVNYIPKLIVILFLLVDDLIRVTKWGIQQISLIINHSNATPEPGVNAITRSEFLSKTALIVASVPVVAFTYGIISGAHDYRIRRQKIWLPNLPRSFEGLRIGQISDIHSGSFYNKKAVKRGVAMLVNEKPDMVFFTGDLVNNEAGEMDDYIDVFDKIKAPLGVYSTLGNHDYGDYKRWPSVEAKIQNLENLKKVHQLLGWELLLNENRIIEQNGDKIAIIGVENWSAIGNFPKYGKLDKAIQGTEEASVKLLLSHDPSHWEAQVCPPLTPSPPEKEKRGIGETERRKTKRFTDSVRN
ncbi:MAG: metallophosphoesterase, partial [Bacteroidetes bacterium]|nr:metallophosphoesterase [Bacteroidota bacterium]